MRPRAVMLQRRALLIFGANLLLFSGLSFVLLTQCLVTIHGPDSTIARLLRKDRKGKISVVIYAIAIPLAFVRWWLAFALYVAVAAMWFVPDRRIERKVSPARDLPEAGPPPSTPDPRDRAT